MSIFNSPSGYHTTVNLLDGGSVTSHVFVRNGSEFNMYGGSVWKVELASIGLPERPLFNISGGELTDLFAGGLSTANLSGGTIDRISYIGDLSTVNIFGYEFDYVPTGGDWGKGQLSGFWSSNKTPFAIDFLSDEIYSLISLVEYNPYELIADAGGPYQVDFGETVVFDGSGSYGDPSIDELKWYVDEEYVGLGETVFLSYDTLVNYFGFDLGLHEVKLQATSIYGVDYDLTSIEIIPEPATLLLLGLGGIFLRRRRKA